MWYRKGGGEGESRERERAERERAERERESRERERERTERESRENAEPQSISLLYNFKSRMERTTPVAREVLKHKAFQGYIKAYRLYSKYYV